MMPAAHVQMKLLTPSTHVPPALAWHAVPSPKAHLSVLVSQSAQLKPALQPPQVVAPGEQSSLFASAQACLATASQTSTQGGTDGQSGVRKSGGMKPSHLARRASGKWQTQLVAPWRAPHDST